MYPIEYGVDCIRLATPASVGTDNPMVQLTLVPLPSDCRNAGLTLARYDVKTKVVPSASAMCQVFMGLSGKFCPGLRLVISGSFHIVTVPRKISAVTFPVRRILPVRPGRL